MFKKLIDLVTVGYFAFYAVTYLTMCDFMEQNTMGKVIITLTVVLAATHLIRFTKPLISKIGSRIKAKKARNYLTRQMLFLM